MSFTALFQLQYSYKYANWNSFKNRSKWVSVEMYRRRFSTAFRTGTVFRTTHIDGCFKNIREAAITRIFAKYLGKQMWRSHFKVKLCKNSKKSYFPKHALVSLFRLVKGLFYFSSRISKGLNYYGGKAVTNLNNLFFFSSCLWDLCYIMEIFTYSTTKSTW